MHAHVRAFFVSFVCMYVIVITCIDAKSMLKCNSTFYGFSHLLLSLSSYHAIRAANFWINNQIQWMRMCFVYKWYFHFIWLWYTIETRYELSIFDDKFQCDAHRFPFFMVWVHFFLLLWWIAITDVIKNYWQMRENVMWYVFGTITL